jgi:hypothetical protein
MSGRGGLPDPRGRWDRDKSLRLDRSIIAFETCLGRAAWRMPDRCRVLAALYALAARRGRA